MKKNVQLLFLKGLWALLIIAILATCKGPQGEIGLQGSTGPQGTQGIAGPAGSANLIVSAWAKVPDSAWLANADRTYFTIAKDDSKITQSILDKGLTIAYYRNTGRDNVVFSLPASNEELTLGFFMVVRDGKGTMNFDLSFSKPHKEPIDFDLEFRWIIVPPQTGGRMKNIDWSNYDSVKKELGIPD